MGLLNTLCPASFALTLLCTAQPATAEIWVLATKSNNIHCTMGDDPETTQMLCALSRRAGPLARPKPADCETDWGHAVFLRESGEARMVCLKRTTHNWPGNFKFETDAATDLGKITCKATRRALECTNADGHGFYFSRREQRVF